VRFASFLFVCGQYYLAAVVGWMPWYIPHVALFASLALALAAGEGLRLAEWLRAKHAAAATGVRTLLGVLVATFVLTAVGQTVAIGRQAQLEMTIIEGQVRGAIGRWLRDHAKSNRETVFLEPLGFIGFYSQLKMLDFPGLCSPEVVAARRRASSTSYPFSWSEIIAMLQPDWLVLRPFERDSITQREPQFLAENYDLATTFDARPQIRDARLVPIRGFLEYNGTFHVYHARQPSSFRGPGYVPLLTRITPEQMTRKESPYAVELAGPNLKAHAPSALTIPVNGKGTRLFGGFGIFEGAYAHPRPSATDGAEFVVTYVATDGLRTELLRRKLDPSAVAADRGLQIFDLTLPASNGQLELTVSAGPYNDSSFDWAYWHDLKLAAFPTSKD
jgi:hypothetical protein